MSSSAARAVTSSGREDEEVGVIVSPDEEAELVQRLADAQKAEKAGRLIPWEQVRAERGM
jgi:hypothetical protein